MKQTLSMLIALLLCLFAFASCDNVSFQNDDSQTTNDTPVCSRINLCYHGNKDTSITIEDAGICSELMTLITKADGTQGESSKGYYGVPYTLTIYFEGNEAPLVFCLWSDSQYSTSEQRDAEGYQYFFNDDLSDLYQYLEEKYPDEFWYSNNSQSGDNNNYVTIETAVSDVMPPYAISCKIPTEHSTDNTTIPIILSFGLVEGCDADTDNYSEIVLRAENDEGQTIIIKRINISEILKSEYFVESVWDDNREWIIGFNYTHRESFTLPLSLFSGTSGQIYIGMYECSSTDLETMKLGCGAYIVLSYTCNESSISISAEVVR